MPPGPIRGARLSGEAPRGVALWRAGWQVDVSWERMFFAPRWDATLTTRAPATQGEASREDAPGHALERTVRGGPGGARRKRGRERLNALAGGGGTALRSATLHPPQTRSAPPVRAARGGEADRGSRARAAPPTTPPWSPGCARRARSWRASATWTSSRWARPRRTAPSVRRETPGTRRAPPAARRGGARSPWPRA